MEGRQEADESLLSAGMTSTSLRLYLLPGAAGVMITLWIKKTDDSGGGGGGTDYIPTTILTKCSLATSQNFEEL